MCMTDDATVKTVFYCVSCGCSQVPGEASETDSEEDPEQTGRASAGSQDSRILRRDLPPLIVVRDRPDVQSIVEDRPSPAHRPHGEEFALNTEDLTA